MSGCTLVRLAIFVYAKSTAVNKAYVNFMIAKRGRPELFPVKKVIGFDEPMLDAVEKWRQKLDPIPTFSEAIRRLVELGLKAKPGK